VAGVPIVPSPIEGTWVHGYVQNPLPEKVKSWQACYTRKYGEWNATSIDFANPAFAFVAAVRKAQSLDQKKIAEALQTVEFENLWGKAHFGGKEYYGGDGSYVLETGSLVLHGPAGDLLRDEGVRKAYLGI
jgi:hypothetical protein